MSVASFPLSDGLDWLVRLQQDGAPPHTALERLQGLRARHPGRTIELVWETNPLGATADYELLITDPSGTASLTFTPHDQVPFPLRAVQNWRDAELVSVNGRRLRLNEAILALDVLWEAPLVERIVDLCLLQREAERERVEVADADVQSAVDRFRDARGLFSVAETEAWLHARSLSLADLEERLAVQVGFEKLRARLVGAEAECAFAADPCLFAEASVVAFPLPSEAEAVARAAEIDAGAPFFSVAEKLLPAAGPSRSGRSILFESLRCVDIEPLFAAALGPGRTLAARLCGAGPYVVQVRSVTPARWDDACREAVEERLLKEWLERARARAHVVWNWGNVSPDQENAGSAS